MKFPEWPLAELVNRLEPPEGTVDIVIDTDTYNEIDDQFALMYALHSPDQMRIQAIYAAPYRHANTPPDVGMENSYQEIKKILKLVDKPHEQFAFKGSEQFLRDPYEPVISDAAADLVQRAMERDTNDPLYVMAIGAITNVASAILLEPKIINKIVVVWLGGHSFASDTAREYNLYQDLYASKIMFDSGVPLVLIPCEGVASHLSTTLAELGRWIRVNPVGEYLYDLLKNRRKDEMGYSRIIWDIAAVAYLVNPSMTPSVLTHSPILTDQVTWSFDQSRHWIRYVKSVNRNEIFGDMFTKLIK